MEKLHLTPVHRDACLCIFALCAKIDILEMKVCGVRLRGVAYVGEGNYAHWLKFLANGQHLT